MQLCCLQAAGGAVDASVWQGSLSYTIFNDDIPLRLRARALAHFRCVEGGGTAEFSCRCRDIAIRVRRAMVIAIRLVPARVDTRTRWHSSDISIHTLLTVPQ